MKIWHLLAVAALLLSTNALGQSKADPDSWILWRAAPIAFPDSITPQVPELMTGEPHIDFGDNGCDLTIVMPDGLADDYEGKTLNWVQRYVVDKVKNATVATASQAFTHLNMRGLLSWDFRPLPDGRFCAVTQIAADAEKMEEFICDARLLSPEQAGATGLQFSEPSRRLHLRVRSKPDGTLFALVINEDLDRPATARLKIPRDARYQVTDVLAGEPRGRMDGDRRLTVTAEAGGAACLKFTPTP